MIIAGKEQKFQLGQALVAAEVVTEQQITDALAAQRADGNRLLLGELLIQQGMCTDEEIMEALAKGYGLPFARISPRIADPRVVEVAGHTDSDGSAQYNQGLSERRAQAVAQYFRTQDIMDQRLITIGQGELSPVADNSTASGKQTNRRVEITMVPVTA